MLKTLFIPYKIRLFIVVKFTKTLWVSGGVMWIDLLFNNLHCC